VCLNLGSQQPNILGDQLHIKYLTINVLRVHLSIFFVWLQYNLSFEANPFYLSDYFWDRKTEEKKKKKKKKK